MSENLYHLDACTDCVMFLANGEVPEDNGDNWSADRIEANWPSNKYNLCIGGDEATETIFSWQPCEVCGCTLGGDRYPVVVWECKEVI